MQNEYICEEKNILRERLKSIRASVTERVEKELAATRNILPYLRGNVLVYVSIGSELSTAFLIEELMRKQNTSVFVPLTADGEITPVRLIKQSGLVDKLGNVPRDCYDECNVTTAIDCCVTPLLGYNRRGYRIGYGKGCYDKLFSRGQIEISKKIGFAFDCQRCNFTADKHDVALDMCVTESGIEVFE